MRHDWTPLRILPHATVRQAIQAIDRSRLGTALVVDASERLVGTVTDGDVRRAILREVALDSPVEGIMERQFVSLPSGASAAAARGVMQGAQVKLVPVVERDGRVLGFYYLPDLLGPEPRPNWAVVMAGGEGRRLRPLTEETPKPMLPVGGQPILEMTLRRLVGDGFTRVFLAVNYRGEQIEAHFGDGGRFGCRIEYLREPRPLDTGGALGLLPEPPALPLLVVNGDLVTDVNFQALLEYHAARQGIATLCVRELAQAVPYGVVRCDEDRVTAMEEKPVQRHLINAGIYVVEPRLLGLVPRNEPCALPDLIAAAMARGERVHAFLVHEQWVDIGRPVDYERVKDGVP